MGFYLRSLGVHVMIYGVIDTERSERREAMRSSIVDHTYVHFWFILPFIISNFINKRGKE